MTSYEELLSTATSQIAMNSTHIVFIMKIPQLSLETYEYEFIDSLIQNQKRVSTGLNLIIKNGTHSFETKEKCLEDNDVLISNSENLKPSSACIKNLIKIQHANCTYEKSYTDGVIKLLKDSLILLNNVNITLQSNCSNNIEGPFIIEFEQCELFLDDHHFSNFLKEISSKSYRPTTGLMAYERVVIDKTPGISWKFNNKT